MLPLLLFILISSTGAIEEGPKEVTAFVFIFFLFSVVANPIIQAYFRRDLTEAFMKIWQKLHIPEISLCHKKIESRTKVTHST